MIEMPRRSVTRFFVPLADVMILLLSMFMLMPVLQEGSESGAGVADLPRAELIDFNIRLKQQLDQLRQTVEQLKSYKLSEEQAKELRDQVAQLQREKINTLKTRLDIRVLEIDPDNGKLLYFDRRRQPPQQEVIGNELEARRLIRRHKREAEERRLEVYYLLLFPRVDSAFPEERQFQQYQHWFKDVAYGVDRPPQLPSR